MKQYDEENIKLGLITERINNFNIEPYYNGERSFASKIKKIQGKIPLNNIPNKAAYKVLEIRNPQPHSDGIISYSLFGDFSSERFRKGLIEPLLYNINEMKIKLPGWSSRLYIAKNIPDDIKIELVDAGYELYIMNVPTKGEGYVWRFLPASENKPFISHDADMRIGKIINSSQSIEVVVNDWLKTDKPFLRRKLNLSSFMDIIPVLAGMWGYRPTQNNVNVLSDIKETLEKYNFEGFGMDEAFLTKEIWPKMKTHGYYSTGWKREVFLISLITLFSILSIVGIIFLVKKLYTKYKNGRRK